MRKRALVVSVSHNPDNMPLPGAERNAGLVTGLLSGREFEGFEIQVLAGSQATRALILEWIDVWLLAGATAGDLRVLAVSAHGETLHPPGQPPNFVFYPGDFAAQAGSLAVGMKEVRTSFAGAAPGVKIVALLDCCRRGASPAPAGGFIETVKRVGRRLEAAFPWWPNSQLREKVVRVVPEMRWVEIWGCGENQSCWYDGKPPAGVFTRAFTGAVAKILSLGRPLTPAAATRWAFDRMWVRVGEAQIPEVRGPHDLLHGPLI